MINLCESPKWSQVFKVIHAKMSQISLLAMLNCTEFWLRRFRASTIWKILPIAKRRVVWTALTCQSPTSIQRTCVRMLSSTYKKGASTCCSWIFSTRTCRCLLTERLHSPHTLAAPRMARKRNAERKQNKT